MLVTPHVEARHVANQLRVAARDNRIAVPLFLLGAAVRAASLTTHTKRPGSSVDVLPVDVRAKDSEALHQSLLPVGWKVPAGQGSDTQNWQQH